MTPTEAFDRLATGEAVSILALGCVVFFLTSVALYRRLTQVQDKRIEDMRLMGQELLDSQKQNNIAIGALTEVVRDLRRTA